MEAAGASAASLLLSEEREDFRRSVRGFLERVSAEPQVREQLASGDGYDDAVWRQMAAQPALQGVAIPERFGGGGFGFSELAVVFEEMGRSLFCAPYLSTVGLAANALLLAGDEEVRERYLPPIAAGELVATLAICEVDGRWDEGGVEVRASKQGDSYALEGRKTYVLDGQAAGLILVVARGEEGIGIYSVEVDAPGLERTRLTTLDPTRRQAQIELRGTPAQLIGDGALGWEVVARVLDRAAALLAAECAGGAARCLEMATEYANERVQFSRPIGSFQAIKHKCADLLVGAESAKSAAYYAGWAADESEQELSIAAPLAKAYASEAFIDAAKENIQIHGGIAITWEHPAHLYLRRAKTSELLLGSPSYQRELLAQRLGV